MCINIYRGVDKNFDDLKCVYICMCTHTHTQRYRHTHTHKLFRVLL